MNQNESILTQSQIQFYHENGYLIVENILSNHDCDLALKIFEEHANNSYSGIMNLDRKVKEIRDIMKHPEIVNLLETLQNAEVIGLQTMFLFKRVNSPYALQAWNPHQDNAYAQAPWGAYITGNIPFADQDPENGGMYIYPGSHKEDILPNVTVKSFHEQPGTNPGHSVKIPEKYKKVDLYLKKGSILMLHGNVIHGSYPNLSKTRSRPMLLIPYLTKGAKFIPGNVAQRMEIPLR
ncbi:MAG: phytanoyl-CoA dioxygenase family protein [Elusimicrobia bacterium]|nr:phytanoyl-CoA dioxygenase family protein [Elusimicrobiota bacterium]